MRHPRHIDAQHLAIQEQDGRQRLVLRTGGDLANRRKRTQERLHFHGTKLARVTFPVGEDEPANPAYVSLLGTQAVVFESDPAPNFVHQPRRRRRRRSICYALVFRCVIHYAPTLEMLRSSLDHDERCRPSDMRLMRCRKST